MTESPLLTLPVEILEKIFKPLFSVPDSEICLGQDNRPTAAVGYQPPWGILRTCKQAGAVGTRVLQSSIAGCRLSLFMNDSAVFTPHAAIFLRQYGKLFRSVHIIERILCFAIGMLFEHLINTEAITFAFGQFYISEDSLSFNSEWHSLEDSELQKQLRRPWMSVSQGVSSYVNKLRSACPRIDELKVRVALCIVFEECATHRLDLRLAWPGGIIVQKQWIKCDIEVCKHRIGSSGHRLLNSDAVDQVFWRRPQDSEDESE